MKQIPISTIAAVLLVGTAFADPIHNFARNGDLAGVQAELDKGVDVNAKDKGWDKDGITPLDTAITFGYDETADLLRKHGGKTKKELKAAGN